MPENVLESKSRDLFEREGHPEEKRSKTDEEKFRGDESCEGVVGHCILIFNSSLLNFSYCLSE